MFASYSLVFINDARQDGYLSYVRFLKKLAENFIRENYSSRFYKTFAIEYSFLT